MRKQLAFGFAAVAIGLVTIAWAEARSSHPITTLFGQRRSWRRPHLPRTYPSRYYARSTDRIIQHETALLNTPAYVPPV